MLKLFISYSRADYIDENGQVLVDSPVNAILEALKATNAIDVWIDVHEHYSGKYFASVLAKKIMWADKILFLSSQNSNSSEWVSKEILYAFENKKEILPVLLDNSTYNVDFALILTGIDYIEYYKNPSKKIVDILDNVLEEPQEPAESTTNFEKTEKASLHNAAQNTKDNPKGCLSFNVNYKGCALSMTIVMGVLFLIGLFVQYNNHEGTKDERVVAEIAPDTSIFNEQEENSIVVAAAPSSKPQAEDIASNPPRGGTEKKESSARKKDHLDKSIPPASDHQSHMAQRKDQPKVEGNEELPPNASDDKPLLAQNSGKPDKEIPTSPTKLGGPTRSLNIIAAMGTDTYTFHFSKEEPVSLIVRGDGYTDLDVYVYDSNGNLILSDEDYTDDCLMEWTPKANEAYRVVIKNRGRVYNNYTITTEQK